MTTHFELNIAKLAGVDALDKYDRDLSNIPSRILVSGSLKVPKLSLVGSVIAVDIQWKLDYTIISTGRTDHEYDIHLRNS